MPAPTEIESARVHAHDFFVENIPIMFSLNLEDASLVAIVSYDEARGHLEAAEAYARQQSYNDMITEIAYAFHALIEEYERRMSGVYGRSPYLFSAVSGFVSPWDPVGLLNVQSSGPLTGPLSINLAAGPRPADARQQALERFAHDVGPALGAIQKGLKILSLGLDYNRYVRFTHLTPSVTRHNGHLTCPAALNMNRREVTSEECQDCIDFVIDAALRLQEAERE